MVEITTEELAKVHPLLLEHTKLGWAQMGTKVRSLVILMTLSQGRMEVASIVNGLNRRRKIKRNWSVPS